MMSIYSVLLCCSVLLLSVGYDKEGWRGITPLTSSRADVERLLGRCPQNAGASCLYETDTEQIMVVYSDGPCEKAWPFGYDVKEDTVIQIEISPLTHTDISDSGFKLDDFEKRVNADGGLLYVSGAKGITLRVFGPKLGSIVYGPTSDQNKLLCTQILGNGSHKGEVVTNPHERFYAYGEVTGQEEVKILKSFAEALRHQSNVHGYIIVYAGERSFKDEAARRIRCQVQYLTKQQMIDSQRFTALEGGYRQKREVELYVLSKQHPPLLPFPTVRPSRVKIIEEGPSEPNILLQLCQPSLTAAAFQAYKPR
jgi:hypothetical protein